MLTLIILIPLFGALLILPMSDTLESHSQMKKIALTTSLINLFISLFLWYQFDSSTSQYQFVSEFNQLNFCHLNFDINSVNSLINSLGLQNTFQSNLFSFTESFNSNSILLQSNNHQNNSKVLSTLDQQYPNWKDSFINSPLEENIIPHIINVLSNNLYLHFIILYLLIMLLIIITCKYILKDNIEFTKIQNNPLGAWIKNIINKLISTWKISSIFWIYFIIFNLLIFNSASIFSMYNLLVLFK